MEIKLRRILAEDLAMYKYWQLPEHRYHQFNGPYFKKASKAAIEEEMAQLAAAFERGDHNPLPKKKIISNVQNELLGEVSWYWKSEETNWLEIGIVIFDPTNWSKGIGKHALQLWIKDLFTAKKELVRLGLTTWSGNLGMICLAEKLGMKREGHHRKILPIRGEWVDNYSYAMLEEDFFIP